jgi:aquaporin Z
LGGITMGLTAISIIYSPWGKQSGAHINPAVTLTFFRLGKVKGWDAFFYMVAQFVGGILGVGLIALLLKGRISDPTVNYAATVPGRSGIAIAFLAEFTIAFLLMNAVLYLTNHSRLARHTGLFVGALVATFITFEAPFSGMSMNPARTLGSALNANVWTAVWIYFAAPVAAMLAAAEFYLWRAGRSSVQCAKYHHDNNKRCIFCGANGGFRA